MPQLVLLAGGKSSRMGMPKGLILQNGITLLEHQVSRFVTCGGQSVLIVTGHIKDSYLPVIGQLTNKFPKLELKVIENPTPEKGQFSSIKSAVCSRIRPDGSFILPIDTPLPETNIFDFLLNNRDHNTDVVIPKIGERGGHPIWISDRIERQIASSPDEARLDVLVWQLSPTVVKRVLYSDSKVLTNLNTPDDLKNWKK